MKKIKYSLHFGGVFGDKEKISQTTRDLVEKLTSRKGPFSKRQILNVCRKLEKIIKKSFKKKEVKVSPVFYPDRRCFLDIDIFFSQKQDKFPFEKTIRFPNNLMRLWKKYQDDLFFSRKKTKGEKIGQRLEIEVNKNLNRLFFILDQDKNPVKRAIAAYLLFFSKRPKKVCKSLLNVLEDDEHSVHNAAGWSLVRISSKYGIEISSKRVLSLIYHHFPGCRNKGLILLDHFLNKVENRNLPLLARQKLLDISRNSQPNYFIAKQILKKIEK